MTVKEVCEKTGLSRKTVRLYQEKGLVTPETEIKNGRSFRNWSEADVETLRTVASLRRAWFTMEEIGTMQRDPAAIQEILPRYVQWLSAQQETVTGLLRAARSLRPAEVDSVEVLSRKLSEEAARLPLPPVDLRPRFRYLDALEAPVSPRGPLEALTADPRNIAVHQDLTAPRLLEDAKSDRKTPPKAPSPADRNEDPPSSVRTRMPVLLLLGLGVLQCVETLLEMFRWRDYFPLSAWYGQLGVGALMLLLAGVSFLYRLWRKAHPLAPEIRRRRGILVCIVGAGYLLGASAFFLTDASTLPEHRILGVLPHLFLLVRCLVELYHYLRNP